ncbi:nuclear transport factor 2 family protein [Pseudonocardia sp. GCM10023141]|uniref:nuclear transport factor 2 family protein n=1 Tax=Pseudonocardia sp. GCM10023141 TaxID=3252653 RepID=UPI00361594F0
MSDPCTAFKTAIEDKDVDAAVALFAVDAVFNSPVVHKPYRGREALRVILGAVVQVFSDFRYTGEYAGERGHVLEFAATVGDRELQGVDILRAGDGGELVELTVLVRPYSAATVLREQMAALLT